MKHIGNKLHTLLNQLFSQVLTMAIHPSKIEIVQLISNQLSEEIVKISSETSLEKCKLINEAIQKAFKIVAEDVIKIENRIIALEEKINKKDKIVD